MGVTSCRLYLEDPFFDGKERHVKSTASKIENEYILFISLLIQSISDGGSRGFINDSENIETRNRSSILSCLTLRVVKVSWYSYNSILDFLAKVSLGNIFHLGKNH
mmetsp:Transcript_10085/g.24476  ORF Transcript_10085/g.24476 Transcript_10085/m.24476 type:complete len:106 (+) Transcript_10085:1476-1793(+)